MKPATKAKEHVTKILEVGKEKGYITYKQVNDILPEEVVSSEEIDDILLMLGENDIKIVDQEEKAATIPDEDKEAGARLPAPSSRTTKRTRARSSRRPSRPQAWKPAWATRSRCTCTRWAASHC